MMMDKIDWLIKLFYRCLCSSKNNQIRPVKVPTINKLKRTNENPETLKCLKFLGQKFCFRIVSKMTQNIYFPFGQDAPKLKKRRKNKIKRFEGLMFKKDVQI